MGPGSEAGTTIYPPALSLTAQLTSSSSEDDTEGTCSPSEAREMATRVLLKRASTPATPAGSASRLVNNSVISTLCCPLESSATLPGVAEDKISALSGGLIGARPWEKARK